ncbi:MAG: hypothetical protein HOO86_02300 [Bacteroidales bacterium]|nr:hypothetical protein [Bacteroidales bacterium]
MKSLRTASLIGIIALFLALSACNSNPKSKLIGIWKAETVDVKFDEQVASPEMIRQVGLENKQVFFKIQNDSVMLLYIDTNSEPQTLFWFLDEANGLIKYAYKQDDMKPIELGKLADGKITAESSTPLGTIKTTFKKE